MDQIMADRDLVLRAPYCDVSVRADRDRTLARVKAVNLGMIGRAERDGAVEVDAAFDDTFREQDRRPRRHTRNAIRHPAETGAPFRHQLALRVVIAERTMVRR